MNDDPRRRHRRAARRLGLLIAAASVAGLSACGGDGGGSGGGGQPAPAPTPTPTARDAAGCVVGSWSVAGGVPAETRYQSDHFAFHWSGTTIAQADAEKAATLLESAYGFYATTIGFRPPHCEDSAKTKINVNVANANATEAAGVSTAGSRGGVGYMDLNGLAIFSDHTLAHELVHVFQSATPGWTVLPHSFWETHANFMVAQTPQLRGDVDCSEDAANSAYLAHGNARTRYCGWQFWDYLARRYGYGAVNAVWTGATAATRDPYSALMATRGWSLAQLNDVFGDWAMRNVTWDYAMPDGFDRGALFRAEYGPYRPDEPIPYRARRLTTLEPIDLAQRRFAVPFAWAPQRWGYNVVRLVADPSATSVSIAFRGVQQAEPAVSALAGGADEPPTIPRPGSGWRWSIVAVDASGAPRYVGPGAGDDATLTIPVRADDQGLYLVVTAAPTIFQPIADDQVYYSIYRYPWMVQIDGAMPWNYQPGAPDRIAGGHRHPNGGGWVGPDASVAPSVHVGRYARVYGGTLTGNARVEDHAIVASGTIGDDAAVGALTTLAGSYALRDRARIGSVFGTIAGNGFTLSGTAQLLGDIQIAGDVRQMLTPDFTGFGRGIYYGMILPSDANDPARGANRSAPVPEITAAPSYVWR